MINPNVAVVLLNYNGAHYLRQFMPSVVSIQYPHYSIWVIDNASTDDSCAFLEENFPQVNIIRLQKNYGFAEGYNHGLKQIEAEFYFLLNNDMMVDKCCIQSAMDLFRENASIHIIQSKIRSYLHPENFDYAGAAGGWLDALGYPFCRGRILEYNEKDSGQYDSAVPVNWASGGCMFIRAATFHELGGFYGYLFMQNEDIDLCWRAWMNGYEVYACPDSVVYHVGAGSLAWHDPKKTFFTFRSNLIMLARNFPLAKLCWLLPLRFVLDWLAAFRFLLIGKPAVGSAIFKSQFAFLKWLLFLPADKGQPKYANRRGVPPKGYYKGSILWQYFIKGKRRFSAIVQPIRR
jgi:hypothetical protein